MRRLLAWLALIAAGLSGSSVLHAQEQFPGDPLPYTIGPFIFNQFMQLDAVSAADGYLHTGIDIATTYPGADQRVVAPIRYGSDCLVQWIGSDFVRLQARDRQGANLAVFEAYHITPDPSLVQGAYITRNAVIGTVLSGPGHLHAGLFLYPGGSTCCEDRYLVHPQRNAFSVVTTGWNADTYVPEVDATVVHSGAVGSPTIFEIHAYDQADMQPSYYNGVYAIRLFVDDNLVDSLRFDKMLSKTGSWPPSGGEYYYCTLPGCTPYGTNNPNVLQYRLVWTTQSGNHIWRIDVFDAKGNLLHGDPHNGLPGREAPAASLGGTIEEGKVCLTWRIAASDLEGAGIQSFSVWQSASPTGDHRLLNADPIRADYGRESYAFTTDAPATPDTTYYRLTALNSVGSTFILGQTRLAGPKLVDALEGYPNPVAAHYTVALSVARSGTADVQLYDLNGRRVRTLHRGSLAAGTTRLTWDGRDDHGQALPNGVYLLQVRTQHGPNFGARKIALFR